MFGKNLLRDLFLPIIFAATAILEACSGTSPTTLPTPNTQSTATATAEATPTKEEAQKIKSEIGINAQKSVFAVYLDWFGQSKWTDWAHWEWTGKMPHNPRNFIAADQRDIASINYPLVGPYRSDDPKLIRYHTRLAKSIGIDALVVDWYTYKDTPNTDLAYMDKNFSRMINIAEEEDYNLSVLMEPKIHFNGWIPHGSRKESVKAVEDDFRHVLKNYSERKGFFKQDKLPVMFVYETWRLTPEEWNYVVEDLEKEGHYFVLVGDVTDPKYLGPFSSLYEWPNYDGVAKEGDSYHNHVLQNLGKTIGKRKDVVPSASVWPGFNDTGVWGWGDGPRILDRKDGDFYQTTWNAALNNNPRWLAVATFNDWNEGTQIEPSRENGYEYLRQTSEYIGRFKGMKIDPAAAVRLTKEYINSR